MGSLLCRGVGKTLRKIREDEFRVEQMGADNASPADKTLDDSSNCAGEQVRRQPAQHVTVPGQ